MSHKDLIGDGFHENSHAYRYLENKPLKETPITLNLDGRYQSRANSLYKNNSFKPLERHTGE